MLKKLLSLFTAFSLLSVGLAAVNISSASAATVTINLDCNNLSGLSSNDGWETVTGSGQNYVESSGKQKRLLVSPNDDYTFTFSNCNYHRAVTPANSISANSLQLTPSPSNSGTVNTGSWAYGGSSLTSLQVVAGATLPTMPISGSNRNHLIVTSGSSINIVNPIVIIFIDPTTAADANLSSLTLRDNSFNTISLSPTFSSNTTSYTASTTASTVSMSAPPAQFNTPVVGTCRGTTLGNPGSNCSLTTGSNTLTLTITAPDKTTTKVYTITVTKSDPVAPTIATTSTISNTQANPTVIITSSASSLTGNPSYWSISTGTTGLTRSSSSSSGGTVTFGFNGTATCGGTLTFKALASAFVSPTETLDSNTLSVVIPAGNCSTDATLSAASTVKGVTITSLGTPGTNPNNIGARGSVTISAAQAADTSNSGSFVTSLVANDSTATVSYRSKNTVNQTPSNINAWSAGAAITNGDFFVVYIRAQDRATFKLYVIDVTVGAGSSTPTPSTPTLSAAEIAVAAATAAKAAAEAAAAVRAAEIATAQTKLSTVLKSDKAGTIDEYKSANINISTAASLSRINAEVLKLSANDRSDFSKIKAIADKIEFDESFFNSTARPTLTTYAKYEVVGITERILPTVNTKVLELPAALRVDAKAIQDLVKVESFVDRVANTETRSTVSANVLVEKGLLSSASPYKYSVVQGLAKYPEGSLNTMAKIEAAIKEQVYKAEAPKRRLAEIKAKIAARNK